MSIPKFLKGYRRTHPLLFVTWIYIASAFALGFVAPRINASYFPWLVSPLDKASISTILSAIASGMITLTGIVFSLVFVIIQFGSSAYSPRITRIFAHSRSLHHALGIFTGTFLYSLMAIWTLGVDRTEIVSAFTVWLAFAWLLASIATLANLVRAFTTLTIGNVLFALSTAGRASIARIHAPLDGGESGAPSAAGRTFEKHNVPVGRTLIYEGDPGYVVRYDTASLVALARLTDTVIHIPYAVGDFLQEGKAVALIQGDNPSISAERICASISLGREREFHHDPRYALRLLVDMAIRALSPAINDPTTAVQALDQIELLLHRLGNANLAVGEVRDESGKVRLVYRAPDWEALLGLGLSEIMQCGATSLQVQRRLAALLDFLSHSVPPSRAASVQRFAAERRAIVSRAFDEGMLKEWANTPDGGGLGGNDG